MNQVKNLTEPTKSPPFIPLNPLMNERKLMKNFGLGGFGNDCGLIMGLQQMTAFQQSIGMEVKESVEKEAQDHPLVTPMRIF